MSTLEKWNPFKFFRRSKESGTDRSETSIEVETAPPAAPTAQHLEPFTAMTRMMDAMLRDPFFRDPFAHFGQVDRWFGDFTPARFGVSVDVVDEADALRVDFELPGMTRDDITLSINNGTLILNGQKRHETKSSEEGIYRSERYFGAVRRAVPLPHDLDFEAAEAHLRDGVLGVRFPKKPQPGTKARAIAIQ